MLNARSMILDDVPACLAILNHIIDVGGSTAYEDRYMHDQFAGHYLDEPPVSNVVMSGDRLVGLQATFDIDDGLYSIGSFTDQQNPTKGAGRVIFMKTLNDCRADGGDAIIAKITSDNTAGLAYYASLGFAPWKTVPKDHQRRNGIWVDRIIKRFDL